MKNKITDKLKDGKHRCTKIAQSLMSGLLFFLCIFVCGCERRQEDGSGLTLLETDGLIASGAAEDSGNLAAESTAEDGGNRTSEGTAGNVTGVLSGGMTLDGDRAGEVADDGARQDSTGGNAQQSATCFVHIYGAVVNPGVYELQEGSRIYQAVSAAGGFSEEACRDYVNQARQVSDGMKIWIPTEKEAAKLLTLSGDGKGGTDGLGGSSAGTVNVSGPYGDSAGIETVDAQTANTDSVGAGADPGAGTAGSGLVNINTATVEQLCTLNGIGESRAKTIIAYREAHGNFTKKEDIMKVTGIKESSYAKIKDQITVGKE
ncbi:MAG: helix-hairpin-helix domain-containing protein [Lachnospiraceae bacterium]|nr:helix-hairpin-helix domain-containing protein [Lachnospiraceae bacterium]